MCPFMFFGFLSQDLEIMTQFPKLGLKADSTPLLLPGVNAY